MNDMGIKAAASVGNLAYLQIPADSMRRFFDGLFPMLAKNKTADVVSGFGHRWRAGHDLLVDVPRTMAKSGVQEASKQAGHILLTDFPTKAGIPIPGLSGTGLGRFLTETCHIPQAYLCLNVVDAGVGILALSEGTMDLLQVCQHQLRMTPSLFFDTFVEGMGEIGLGTLVKNPLLIISGGEQLLAGVISVFHTVTLPPWFTEPMPLFGGALSGVLFSLAVSKFILKKDACTCFADALQSGMIGALFAIAPGLGMTGLALVAAYHFGKALGGKEEENGRKQRGASPLQKPSSVAQCEEWFWPSLFPEGEGASLSQPISLDAKKSSFSELWSGAKKFQWLPE